MFQNAIRYAINIIFETLLAWLYGPGTLEEISQGLHQYITKCTCLNFVPHLMKKNKLNYAVGVLKINL